MERTAIIERKTKETDIKVSLNIDGGGVSKIRTGIGFFDHMLNLFSRHSLMDLEINATGDLKIDFHHTVEDIGITLGEAVCKSLGDKKGINRFGYSYIPMDESLARAVVDLSGRGYLVYKYYSNVFIKDFDPGLVKEFFKAFAENAKMNIHIEVLYGENAHHQVEAIFKAFAKALFQAASFNEKIKGLPSTKGKL